MQMVLFVRVSFGWLSNHFALELLAKLQFHVRRAKSREPNHWLSRCRSFVCPRKNAECRRRMLMCRNRVSEAAKLKKNKKQSNLTFGCSVRLLHNLPVCRARAPELCAVEWKNLDVSHPISSSPLFSSPSRRLMHTPTSGDRMRTAYFTRPMICVAYWKTVPKFCIVSNGRRWNGGENKWADTTWDLFMWRQIFQATTRRCESLHRNQLKQHGVNWVDVQKRIHHSENNKFFGFRGIFWISFCFLCIETHWKFETWSKCEILRKYSFGGDLWLIFMLTTLLSGHRPYALT